MKALETIDRNANGYESIDDFLIGEFMTYEDIGELVTELLRYFGGSNGHDDRALDFIRPMVKDYLNDRI